MLRPRAGEIFGSCNRREQGTSKVATGIESLIRREIDNLDINVSEVNHGRRGSYGPSSNQLSRK